MFKTRDIISCFAPLTAELETVVVTFNTNTEKGPKQVVSFTYNIKEQEHVDKWLSSNNIVPRDVSDRFWGTNEFNEKHWYKTVKYEIQENNSYPSQKGR